MTTLILSMDGGGIRAQWGATILRRLDEALPGWIDVVEIFAGASIGGIMALALANGYKADLVEEMFNRYGRKIFRPSSSIIPTKLHRYFRAGYSTDNLNRLLDEFFGNIKLGDINKRVIVPAFKLDHLEAESSQRRWRPVIFHNDACRSDNHCQTSVRQVMLFATATPTIFPSVEGYVDGGLVANNPSMLALTHLQGERYRANDQPAADSIALLSIGTGYGPQYIEEKTVDWGIIQWQKHLLDLMNGGSIQLVDQQCRLILEKGYHRLCPALTVKINANDESKLDLLKNLAEAVDLRPTISWLQANCLND